MQLLLMSSRKRSTNSLKLTFSHKFSQYLLNDPMDFNEFDATTIYSIKQYKIFVYLQ